MKKVLFAVGTRPEAIKLAPLVKHMSSLGTVTVEVLATAQHREMLDDVLSVFEIQPTLDLDLMRTGQTLVEVTSRILVEGSKALDIMKPDLLVVQGDTTTVLAMTLAAFYKGIPVAHVEAGLRTGDMSNPFPEEANRVLTTRMVELHFAPTEDASMALVLEGVPREKIWITGNTVIDALSLARKMIGTNATSNLTRKTVLVTTHRRENFGQPLLEIVEAVSRLAKTHSDVDFIIPTHPNPNVKTVIETRLNGFSNVQLLPPLSYLDLIRALEKCHFVMTDSGGIQEEAPSFGKPVLILREETERPEAVELGYSKLVGHDTDKIFTEATRLLTDTTHYETMVCSESPYGDGHASRRITEAIETFLNQ